MKYSKELHKKLLNHYGAIGHTAKVALLDEIGRLQIENALLRANMLDCEIFREKINWISVSERLPDVIDGYCIHAIVVNMNGDKRPFTASYSKFGFDALTVTHWINMEDILDSLPLPEQKEEK